ncbi:hypothetical protein ACFQE8_18590 [Salinirubellus sp. GCM10025818]|uniref:hypothetical protein n=1 Tax=Salinirubellus TaxID=2162630 RepID=UPI0030CDAB1B
MTRSRRLVLASLVALALLSVVVVAEAERNYATVTTLDRSTASVVDATLEERAVVTLRVHNSMRRAVRVEYVTISLSGDNASGLASTPYNEHRKLPPGEERITGVVPLRQVDGELAEGDRVTVGGSVAVRVYNAYRFEIPIEPTEVTL